jgi:branched-chain amino acid transport system permease protein
VNARGTLVLTFVAGLVMIIAAVGTRRLLTLTVALIGLLGALVLPISAPDTWIEPAALSVAFAIAGLGVVVLTGWAGELFLAPLAITGLAAYATAWFAGDQGQPAVIAVTYALALALILGAIAGAICAVQRSGAVVAVIGIGVAAVLSDAVFRSHAIGGVRHLSPALAHPLRMGGYEVEADVMLYYALLLLLIIGVLTVLVLRESRLAAALRASRSGVQRAEVRGVDVTAGRFAAHMIAAALGGVAGCCIALDLGRVAPDQFSPLRSLVLVGSVLLFGRSRVIAGLLAGVVVGAVPEVMARYHPLARYNVADVDLAVGALLLVAAVAGELLRGARARGLLQRLPLRVPRRGRRDSTAAVTDAH